MRIEDYALVGDLQSAAIVGSDGSVDWLCVPRFDSAACFAALVGDAGHGRWLLAPAGTVTRTSRRYRPGTLVLETDFETPDGAVRVVDFMPRRGDAAPRLMRIVEGLSGRVPMRLELVLRPDYGSITPWLQDAPDGVVAVTGPDAFRLSTPIALSIEHGTVRADFTAIEGARERFSLGWWPSHEPSPPVEDADSALARTEAWWREWSERCTYDGEYREAVLGSLIALKAMTFEPTGAIVAAPTTSLPEDLGGVRNWDYRYTWLRDATFTLYALNVLGFTEEARAFTHWLRRLSYANGEDLQIMYGIRGERDLTERDLPHLTGYCASNPVRVGNSAANQKQLDVFGEVLDCIHLYRRQGCFERYGETLDGPLWAMLQTLVEHVCAHWQEPDSGIWEVRGDLRHFVYSKVMCWVALDRGIRAAQQLHLEADLPRWCLVRDQIRTDILSHGYNTSLGAFTQSYDESTLDASNLMLPLVGFIPPDDPRMRSTVDRIMEQITDENGFVYRYYTDDGLTGSEGTFTICTFWLVDNLAMQGRVAEARSLFERLLSYAGRLGLFSEEIDSRENVALGNYPQAFTHIALINSAVN